MTKSELRDVVSCDLLNYLSTGGKVTVCKSAKTRRRNSAWGHQKLSFGWKAPVNRPSNPWDLVL